MAVGYPRCNGPWAREVAALEGTVAGKEKKVEEASKVLMEIGRAQGGSCGERGLWHGAAAQGGQEETHQGLAILRFESRDGD